MRLSREIREGVLLPESFIWFRLFSRFAPSAFRSTWNLFPATRLFVCLLYGAWKGESRGRKSLLCQCQLKSLLISAGFWLNLDLDLHPALFLDKVGHYRDSEHLALISQIGPVEGG